MTDRERFLAALTRPVTLQSGATVTIRAWGLDHIEQHTSDFFAFLRLFVQGVRGAAIEEQPALLGLLGRVARSSLADPADADLLTVADIPTVAQAVYDLNGLDNVAGKLIGLLTRAQQAVSDALPANPSTSPS
ncbi:hypothetical protein DM785_02240 [Deinococcus actinosclerus]|nr:hypothetical protein DM785_02240 [Deinococcus actinosclerus]